MKYTKKHIADVDARLQEYVDVLAGKGFTKLNSCNVCHSASGCGGCLWGGYEDEHAFNCLSTGSIYGDECTTKSEQRTQFKHLLSQLDKNGYQFKAVK